MKNFGYITSLLILCIGFTACEFFNITNPPVVEKTTAEVITDEYIASVQSSESQASGGGRSLVTSEASQLKTAILAKINSDGLSNSKDMKVLLPSFMDGVSTGVGQLDSLSVDPAAKGKLLGKAFESGTDSLSKAGRLANKATAGEIIASLAKKAVAALNVHVADPVVQAQILSASVEATIRVVGLVTDLNMADVTKQMTATLVAEVTLSGNKQLVQNIALGVAKAVANKANAAAMIQATLEGALVGSAKASFETTGSNATTDMNAALQQMTAGLSSVTGIVIDKATLDTAVLSSTASVKTALNTTTAPVMDTTTVAAVADEAQPVAVLTVKNGTTEVSILPYSTTEYSLTLGNLGTTASGVTVTLKQTSGPSVALTGVPVFPLTIKVSAPGVYAFVLTVKNTNGIKAAVANVSFTLQPDATNPASALVSAGVVALAGKNFDLARSKFTAGVIANPADTQAIMWSSFMDVLGTTTDAGMVDLMVNRIGLLDYPASMDALFADDIKTVMESSWFKGQYYKNKEGFIKQVSIPIYEYDTYIKGRLEDSQSAYFSGHDADGNYVGFSGKTFVPDNAGTYYAKSWSTQETIVTPGSGVYLKVRLISRPDLTFGYPVYDAAGKTVSLITGQVPVLDPLGTYYAYYKALATDTATVFSYYYELTETYDISTNYLYNYAHTYAKTHPETEIYKRVYDIPNLTAPVMLPRIEKPTWMPALGYSEGSITTYPIILMASIAERNPTGLNTLIDGLLANLFGSQFDKLMTRIESLPNNVRIAIDQNLLKAYGAPALPAGVNLSLGKSEILTYAAQLKAYKAFIQYLASVNFDYPIALAFPEYAKLDIHTDPVDTDKDGIPDIAESLAISMPGIFKSTLMKERNAASRTASKVTFLSALNNVRTAAGLIQTSWADAASYYRKTYATASGTAPEVSILDNITNAINKAKSGLDLVYAAIDTNGSLYLPKTVNPQDMFSSTWAWPTAAAVDGTTKVVKPGALWTENMLDPRAWFENDAAGFKFSVRWSRYDTSTASSPSVNVRGMFALNPDVPFTESSFGINANTADVYANVLIKGLVSQVQKFVPATTVEELEYFYFPISGRYGYKSYYSVDPFPLDKLQLSAGDKLLLNWINK